MVVRGRLLLFERPGFDAAATVARRETDAAGVGRGDACVVASGDEGAVA